MDEVVKSAPHQLVIENCLYLVVIRGAVGHRYRARWLRTVGALLVWAEAIHFDRRIEAESPRQSQRIRVGSCRVSDLKRALPPGFFARFRFYCPATGSHDLVTAR